MPVAQSVEQVAIEPGSCLREDGQRSLSGVAPHDIPSGRLRPGTYVSGERFKLGVWGSVKRTTSQSVHNAAQQAVWRCSAGTASSLDGDVRVEARGGAR